MELELFAQAGPNNAAFKAGQTIGIVMAVIISAAIPISVGSSRGQPILGVLGAVCTIPGAVLFGCLGGLPIAGLFCVIIMAVSGSGGGTKRKKKRKKPRDDYDDEDDYDRPRGSRRDAYDDDEDDYDRPRRSRRDEYDEDDDYDDRPRRRRRDD